MSKKPDKHRGSRTHGRGKKSGRGAGLRGGKGNAGLNKHNQLRVKIDNPDYFGRKGFKRAPSLHRHKGTINVGNIQSDLPKYLEDGTAKKEGKNIVIDLTLTEYEKLLGAGAVRTPMTIKVTEATRKAKAKVEAAGGKVEVPGETQEKSDDEE